MKNNTKSSITLPSSEFNLVLRLKKELKMKSNVEVIRESLALLAECKSKKVLAEKFKAASQKIRKQNLSEYADLDRLSDEGLN